MARKITHIFIFLLLAMPVFAQSEEARKMSPMLRRMVREYALENRSTKPDGSKSSEETSGKSLFNVKIHLGQREIIALVKCDDPSILRQNGCKTIRQWDDIYATSIPLNRLRELAKLPEIKRIEAGEPCKVCTDTSATILGVKGLWQGKWFTEANAQGIATPPQLTGKGVIMGIQDIGFDLTHPTFYSRDQKEYRIKSFWDMLDPDTLESKLYVGRDYTSFEELMQKKHATDGKKQTHGVHTAGIAAGSGYDTPYVGMAPEAELCLVSNAVASDSEFIREEDRDKYTTATDLLGFQYIFDYAEKVGKPCVISFSEGAHEDLYGDAQLAYEVLGKMTGPGRIIVASAGNSSVNKTYLHKPVGKDSISSFIYSSSESAYYTLRHSAETEIKLHFSRNSSPGKPFYTYTVSTDHICAQEDSLLIDTLKMEEQDYLLLMASYPSCYNPNEWATELYIRTLTSGSIGTGNDQRIRLTLTGKEEEVECFASGGLFMNISSLPEYSTAVPTHNINFPAACSSVIAVGGTAHRTGVYNYMGQPKNYDMGNDGRRWIYSSVGPTMQGLTKPDVVAPACNIISAYSSFYIEENPNAADVSWDVSHFKFKDRVYAWNANSGTSMSSPIVGGIVALWLQLCPTLSPQDILQVIQATSHRYDPQLPYPNNEYGWGEIDALEGARYIKEHFEGNNISDLENTDNEHGKAEYYIDLQGRKLTQEPEHGIYLIKYKSGYTKKMKK